MMRAAGLVAACVALFAATADAQVSICGHTADGGSSSCSPVNSGQLFIAIAPFTFFPILILWALSCWCCLKENDIEVGEYAPASCCARRYTPPASTASAAPLFSSPSGPVISSPMPYSSAANTSPASATDNPEAVGIQMGPTPAAAPASGTTVVEARRSPSLTAADDSEESEPSSRSVGAGQRPGSAGNAGAAARRGRGGNNARSRSPAAGGNNHKSAAAAAAAAARVRAEAAKAEKESAIAEVLSAAAAPAAGSGAASGPGGEWDSGVWECPICTALNPKSAAARCSVCEAKRPGVLPHRAGAGPSL